MFEQEAFWDFPFTPSQTPREENVHKCIECDGNSYVLKINAFAVCMLH